MHEFPCPQPVSVFIRLGGGSVDVVAEARDTAAVVVSPVDDHEASRTAAANTRVELVGDRLTVEAPESGGGWLFRRGYRLRVDIRVPLDSRVQSRTGSADVSCHGRLADASVHTGSGDVFIAETTGDVTVNVGSGDVRAERVGGALRVNGASGDITAGQAGSDIVVHSASGDIEVEYAAQSVRATTASGDVRVGNASTGEIRVNSASGDVTVGVAAGTRVWVDLNTISGSTSSDLASSGQAPDDGPQLNLQVRTVSGDIKIHRTAAPANRPATA